MVSHKRIPGWEDLQEAELTERAHHVKVQKTEHTTSTKDDTQRIDAGDNEAPVTVIFASLLIPGDGEPQENQMVVSQGTAIIWVGPQARLPSKYAGLQQFNVPVLMPGLWDVHVHFFGTGFGPNAVDMHFTDQTQAGVRCARSAYDFLMSGYTSVRCMGGYGAEVGRVIDEGLIPGPHIYAAGAALSQTAGHGDVFQLPLATVDDHNNVRYPSVCIIADGLDECRKAVRANIRRGAKVIKVLASGGVISRDDDPIYQQYSDEELALIVSEAKRMGRSVAAHVHSKAGMLAAIRAGCRSLEHGSYLDEEVAAKMKEAGTIYVPTRTVVEVSLQNRDRLTPEQRAKLDKIVPFADKAYRTAIRSGVTIAFGTDCDGVPGGPRSPGQSALELKYGVKFGLTPLQTIKCATVNAVLTVGAQAPPRTGQIREGYDADMIAVQKNPLEEIDVMLEVSNISHVWKSGKLWKKDGIGSFLGHDPTP